MVLVTAYVDGMLIIGAPGDIDQVVMDLATRFNLKGFRMCMLPYWDRSALPA